MRTERRQDFAFRWFLAAILLPVCLLSSCEEEPACAIDEAKLILILADIQVAEAAAQSLIGPTKDSVLDVYYRQIYTIHKVREADFLECFELLEAEPGRMNQLYESVLEELNRQEAQNADSEGEKEED